MSTRTCPGCGAQYLATATVCADCRLALVDDAEALEEGDEVLDGGDEGDEGGGVAYDLSDWDDDQRDELERGLREAGVPWEWDGDELVVDERDEATAEALIEAVDFPDALSPEEDEGDDGEVLADLFVAADRLAGNPAHPAAVPALLDWEPPASAPYGVDARTWDDLAARVAALSQALAEDDDPERVQALARHLRDGLRPLV